MNGVSSRVRESSPTLALAEAQLRFFGGRVTDSLTEEVTHVVVADNAQTAQTARTRLHLIRAACKKYY